MGTTSSFMLPPTGLANQDMAEFRRNVGKGGFSYSRSGKLSITSGGWLPRSARALVRPSAGNSSPIVQDLPDMAGVILDLELIWVWLLWNDAEVAHFQVLDEEARISGAGKAGDMIISPDFGSKNAIQRIGGTRPAADPVIAGPPTQIPLMPSRQDNSTRKCSRAKAVQLSHTSATRVLPNGQGPQWGRSVTCETRVGTALTGSRENQQGCHD
jgi:hypothetical protein